MSKYPVKLAERIRAHPVRKKESDAVDVQESDAVDVLAPASRSHSFLSFRYSYTEMSVLGGKAHVKSRNARFEEGKLTSETFEGAGASGLLHYGPPGCKSWRRFKGGGPMSEATKARVVGFNHIALEVGD